MDLPCNDLTRSAAKRDKYLMHQCVSRAGIRTAEQIRTSSRDEAVSWFTSRRFSKPVVVKPLRSAGTDGVRVCETTDDVAQAFDAILGTTDRLGGHNSSVLLQELLEGTEFAVNAVCCNGRHTFLNFIRYQKRLVDGKYRVYEADHYVPSEDRINLVLADYVSRVLDALGIRNGPSHSEVFIDDVGPVLVETAGRIDGLSDYEDDRRCYGESQLDLTVEAYTSPHTFVRHPYIMKSHMNRCVVNLVAESSRRLSGIADLRKLSSFRDMKMRVAEGQFVSPTIDLFTSPGHIFLANEDPARLQKDYDFIRAWERHHC